MGPTHPVSNCRPALVPGHPHRGDGALCQSRASKAHGHAPSPCTRTPLGFLSGSISHPPCLPTVAWGNHWACSETCHSPASPLSATTLHPHSRQQGKSSGASYMAQQALQGRAGRRPPRGGSAQLHAASMSLASLPSPTPLGTRMPFYHLHCLPSPSGSLALLLCCHSCPHTSISITLMGRLTPRTKRQALHGAHKWGDHAA